MSVDKKTATLAAITITASLLIAFSVSISFNWYYTNYYLKQEITNIFTDLANKLGNQTVPPIQVNVTLPNQNQSQTNQSTPQPEPGPKPVCKSTEVYDPTSNECVAKPVPTPTPTPTPTPQPTARPFTFTVVGDVEASTDGTQVFNAIKKQNATYDFVLGDLGYANDLTWFKKNYGSLGDKMFCVIGNHESSAEDGTASLQKAAQEYCGDSYWIKEGSSLFFLFNTNGNLDVQLGKGQALLMNTTFMKDVKTLHVMSHKPCVSPPNSHHPAPESASIKTFCQSLTAKIPSNVKYDFIQAHNHVMSSSADGHYKQVGSGGRSHYTCGVNAAFPFCDNVHYGFLKGTVKADGTTTYQFLDYNGKVVK